MARLAEREKNQFSDSEDEKPTKRKLIMGDSDKKKMLKFTKAIKKFARNKIESHETVRELEEH